MNISLLSKYRTQLMGIAIIWVMFFHSSIVVNSPILGFIKNIGFGGVDIFIFLSGFGIFYSLDKGGSIKDFYKRRVVRILPYYLPIVILISLYYYFAGIWSLKGVVSNILTLSYWLDYKERFDWYIPAALVMYLCSPLFFKYFKINKYKTTAVVVIPCLIFWFIFADTRYSYLIAFLSRVPLYIIGIWYASYCKDNPKKQIKAKGVFFLLMYAICCLIILLFLYRYINRWSDTGAPIFAFLLGTVPLCLLISGGLSLAKSHKYPILSFFGTYSLTLYIFHERIMTVMTYNNFLFHYNTIAFILTLICAFAWQKIIGYILEKK